MHRAGTALPGVKNSFYMMNRNIPIALMAVCLLIGSCSKGESSQALPAETQTVTFEAVLPDGVMSRAYGDGLTATCLTYAVYEAGKQSPLMTSRMPGAAEVTFDNRTATLSLRLATGREYDLLFWADAYGDDESSPYDIDFETQTLTVDYSGAMSNDERRDGFYAVVRDLAVEADRPVSRSVMLTRPFAQLNVGTGESDMAAAVADGLRAEMAKRALIRPVDERNPDPFYADMERRALEKVNALGIGPQGFGGRVTALAVNINAYPAHIAGTACVVNVGCHATRHASRTL